MKGINTPPGQALDPGGKASFFAPRGEVWILTLPALAREREHSMVPLLSLRLPIIAGESTGKSLRAQMYGSTSGGSHVSS